MMIEFKLYISSLSVKYQKVIQDLKVFLTDNFDGEYHLKVINILEDIQSAERDRVLATPTLIKASPEPQKRVIGDLCYRDKLITILKN